MLEHPVLQTDTVTVNDDVVRLGDLFQGLDEKADRAVAYAPAPGRRAVFDARWLYRAAQAHALDWRPQSLRDRVRVERASTVIDREEIEQHVLDALADEGVDIDRATVRLSNRTLRLHLPADTEPEVSVEDVTYDARRSRFSAVIAVIADGADDRRLRVSGQLQRMVDVPVLARRLARGELISADDVRWISQSSRGLRRNVIMSAEDLVGFETKRALSAGSPVNAADVRPPIAVGKGDLVTIQFRTARMHLTARGQALENGGRGDLIRVTNLQSRQIVEAVVRGPGVVAVGQSFSTTVH